MIFEISWTRVLSLALPFYKSKQLLETLFNSPITVTPSERVLLYLTHLLSVTHTETQSPEKQDN